MKKTSFHFLVISILIFTILFAPAFLWASSEKIAVLKYEDLNEIDYSSHYYNTADGFIAESHLTRTSHLDEGHFTEKSIFQTKFLNTDKVADANDLASVLENYK